MPAILAGIASAALTGLALVGLRRFGIYDRPNARSLHSRATLRGGGVAPVAVVLFIWIWLDWPLDRNEAVLFAAALIIAGIGALDDLRGLDWRVRLGAQAIAVALAVFGGGLSIEILGGDLVWLDRLLLALALLWFVNLYNFMDGIDGITAAETAMACLGLVCIAVVTGIGEGLGTKAAILGGAALGFLVWNWHPARIFLGDIGSLTLGFLVAWLLIDLGRDGALPAALILPGFFLLDASATLVRRAVRGAPVWQPHKEHAYQRAVQAGMSHAGVVLRIVCLNAALVILALVSLAAPMIAVVAAAAATAGFWVWLPVQGLGGQPPR